MGSGSWGTAFAMVLADAGTEVVLWAKDPELAETINSTHQNAAYHPGIELPRTLWATPDPPLAMAEADFVVLDSLSTHPSPRVWRPPSTHGALFCSFCRATRPTSIRLRAPGAS